MVNLKNYRRTGVILYKKLYALLLPSIMCAAALTLNEFADSILMSNLLGSRALTIINYCYCIVCGFAAVAYLCGYGGSIAYAKLAGQKKSKEAQNVYYKSLTFAFFISLVILILGIVFRKNIATFICQDATLLPDLQNYMLPLIISGPFFIMINVICLFLPVFGQANMSMIIMLLANLINIAMDYCYVRFFDFDISAASLATLTGYVCATILLFVFILLGRTQNIFKLRLFENAREAYEILITGMPFGLAQICFSISAVYVNNLALRLGGEAGLIAIALETQLMSIVSIVQCGVRETVSSFAAVLRSAKDNIGIKIVMRTCIALMTIFSTLFAIFIEIFPEIFLEIFNITEPDEVAVSIVAVRILVLTHIVRSIVMLLRNYLSAIGFNYYSLFISCFDGLLGVVIFSIILTRLFGLCGLWITYPVYALFMFIGIIVINKLITLKNPKYNGILLLETPDSLAQMNMTILSEDQVGSFISKKIQKFCLDNHVPGYKSMVSGLLTEEMCVFEARRNDKSLLIDIKLDIYSDKVKIDFRSLGVPANPLMAEDTDFNENIVILQKVSSKLLYDYALGINSVSLVIDVDGE